ncbi:MAG: site-specific DNA-methyltransferase [Thermomicrobiales bacterium]|nr:site-specific DNA-methyltransferase [Thermomicrobiales bacterium]MCO5218234.1 site-specific DNA-methyltransferase [Thermomicrobiales bacterium]
MNDPLAAISALLRDLPATSPAGDAPLPDPDANTILHMDNLAAMSLIRDQSIDFIYLDPPFASSAHYWREIRLPGHTVRQPAYIDHWPNGLSGYLAFLVPRLAATRRLLKPTGSICVHLDTHSSHYVKVALDAIFGPELLVNEVVWRYGKMSNTSRRFPQNHDTLLVYAASSDWYFEPVRNQPSEYRNRFLRDLTGNQVLYGSVKHRQDKLILRRIAARTKELGRDLRDSDILFDFDLERKVQDDVFTDISIVKGNAREGTGYDTQKPQQLLERLISAYSPPDGVVADFFCGSGTTGAAASALNRRWILADYGLPAIQLSRLRLAASTPTFRRDPALQSPTFDIDATGAIRDYRLEEIDLSASDEAIVASQLETDPSPLLVGRIGDIVIDVFGREATLPD